MRVTLDVLEHRVKLLGLARTSVMFGALGVQAGTADTVQYSKAHVSKQTQKEYLYTVICIGRKPSDRAAKCCGSSQLCVSPHSLANQETVAAVSHQFCSAALMDAPAQPAFKLRSLS